MPTWKEHEAWALKNGIKREAIKFVNRLIDKPERYIREELQNPSVFNFVCESLGEERVIPVIEKVPISWTEQHWEIPKVIPIREFLREIATGQRVIRHGELHRWKYFSLNEEDYSIDLELVIAIASYYFNEEGKKAVENHLDLDARPHLIKHLKNTIIIPLLFEDMTGTISLPDGRRLPKLPYYRPLFRNVESLISELEENDDIDIFVRNFKRILRDTKELILGGELEKLLEIYKELKKRGYIQDKEEEALMPEEREEQRKEKLKEHLSREIELATSESDLKWIIDEIMKASAEGKFSAEDALELHNKVEAKRKELIEKEEELRKEIKAEKRPKKAKKKKLKGPPAGMPLAGPPEEEYREYLRELEFWRLKNLYENRAMVPLSKWQAEILEDVYIERSVKGKPAPAVRKKLIKISEIPDDVPLKDVLDEEQLKFIKRLALRDFPGPEYYRRWEEASKKSQNIINGTNIDYAIEYWLRKDVTTEEELAEHGLKP